MSVDSRYEAPIHALRAFAVGGDCKELAEWIRGTLGRDPVVLETPDGSTLRLELYFSVPDEALLVKSVLERRPDVDAVEYCCLKPRAWELAYRKKFRRRLIRGRLEICPVWEADAPEGKRPRVLIDPGLSFGTGEHFTTTFCLEMMDEVWLKSRPASFLDAGAGSGLLAIAAAKMGCPRVVAVEADGDVVPYTRQNAVLNGVESGLKIMCQDIREGLPDGPFEVTCANLYGGLLLECAGTLIRSTSRWLILSGIREDELDCVQARLEALGGKTLARRGDGEWGGLVVCTADYGNGKDSTNE